MATVAVGLFTALTLAACATSRPPGNTAGPGTVGRGPAPSCERLQSRVPQESLLAAATFLKTNYPDAQWFAEVRDGRDPRSQDRWPDRFQTCAVLADNQLRIRRTSCAQVAGALLDARQWPTWYANAADVRLGEDALRAGARFLFTTFGSAQTCAVVEATPTRVSWTCENTCFLGLCGGDIHHRWNCTEADDGALVSTQECQVGPAIQAAVGLLPGAAGTTMKDTMQRGHQVWLESLACRLAK